MTEEQKVPKGDKFIALTAYLEKCGKDEIKMSFSEIERIIGFRLSDSAYTYPAQWSNSESQSFAFGWLNAGYLTRQVNIPEQTVEFVREGMAVPRQETNSPKKEIEESGEYFVSKPMSNIELINGSCTDQDVDVVVNAANNGLWAGGGICGVIFKKAGMVELTNACKKHKTPLNDGDAVITPAFNLKNAKAIIHAVGPNFRNTPHAFKELFNAYYNSLVVMKENGYHSISFPLISAGIFGGSLDNPAAESTKQCCRAYKKFREDYPMYAVDVKLCAFSSNEMVEAQKEFEKHI